MKGIDVLFRQVHRILTPKWESNGNKFDLFDCNSIIKLIA